MLLRVGIFFGGESAEHEVSIRSAKAITAALDRTKFSVTLIGIDKEGLWHLPKEDFEFSGQGVHFSEISSVLTRIDIAFPVLHGPLGEDGTIQGLFEMVGLPYVGAGVLGSAACMDKDITKRLLRDAGLPIVEYLSIKSHLPFEEVVEKIGVPFYVKPASFGSSVGVERVHSESEYESALENAFSYDEKILLEREIKGREIECALLEDGVIKASLPGEIIPKDGFYSYEAKYIDPEGAKFCLPASLTRDQQIEVQELAIKAFEVLSCEGMARVDFLFEDNKIFFINEVNTIPGFTNISLYPKLWEISGLSMGHLIEILLKEGLKRAKKRENRALSVKLFIENTQLTSQE